MSHLDTTKLAKLIELTSGKPEIKIGLIDGPVITSHPDLENANIQEIAGRRGTCSNASSMACVHGTFVAGILSAKRSSYAPSICPGCTLLVCPIFTEATGEQAPSSTPIELAEAIIECIDAGVNVINMSVALVQPYGGLAELKEALDYSMRRGVLSIVAAGNQGYIGSSLLTSHAWSIPVIASDALGRPVSNSNLGKSIGMLGLAAPGTSITSLGPNGKPLTMGGTSVAAPFVAGTAALLWSLFPEATASEIKMALRPQKQKASIVPPLLDAMAAYQILVKKNSIRRN